tara:strand:- start:15 stop:476 length:462 start_codon:yes stop_codon:yes gene_type:complete
MNKIGYATKYVSKTTRAGRDGREIVCPVCDHTATVYHFSWSALECNGCHSDVEKNAWIIKEGRTEKLDFEVMIRPRVADCSHSDVIVVPAYDVEDAFKRTRKLLKNGAHVPDLGKSVDYIVKGVIAPGDELYGLDETCDCGRASAYIGCSYII